MQELVQHDSAHLSDIRHKTIILQAFLHNVVVLPMILFNFVGEKPRYIKWDSIKEAK